MWTQSLTWREFPSSPMHPRIFAAHMKECATCMPTVAEVTHGATLRNRVLHTLYHITSLLEKFIGYREEYKGVYTTILFSCFSMHVFMLV